LILIALRGAEARSSTVARTMMLQPMVVHTVASLV